VIDALVPMAFVADVARSVAFYQKLGFEVCNRIEDQWAMMESAEARVMFSRASEPVDATQQAVLFYLYTRDVKALRQGLLAKGVAVSEIKHPDYMEEGEVRVEDPDGYVLLIGQEQPT
jgi:catechol 2,3-dioxygenase-like lactoylglutathione lyase family enzyme